MLQAAYLEGMEAKTIRVFDPIRFNNRPAWSQTRRWPGRFRRSL